MSKTSECGENEISTVWSMKLDGKYDCKVVRTGDYKGRLELWEGGEKLKEKEVSLWYNAIFGPDIANVMEWENQLMEWVDGGGT